MLSFTANDTTFYEACRTALELIEEISAIPLEYMRAMGLAMVRRVQKFILRMLNVVSCKSFQAWVISSVALSKRSCQSPIISI